jgi:hypothetical protein
LETDVDFLRSTFNQPGAKAEPYSPYVEYAYQEKDFSGVCAVKTHHWCSEDLSLGRPCVLPDCSTVEIDRTCSSGASESCTTQPQAPCQHRISALGQENFSTWRKQLFLEARLRIVIPEGNRGRFVDDTFHVSGAASKGEMHLSHFRGPLNVLGQEGKTILLPAGITAAATWCTGTDIWNQNQVYRDPQGRTTVLPAVRCEATIENISYQSEALCDDVEKCLFSGGVMNKEGNCVGGQRPQEMTAPQNVRLAVGGGPTTVFDAEHIGSVGINPVRRIGIRELEHYYGTPPGMLGMALLNLPPEGTLEIVEPSPLGQASLLWSEGGMQNVVTIDQAGSVVKWRGLPR